MARAGQRIDFGLPFRVDAQLDEAAPQRPAVSRAASARGDEPSAVDGSGARQPHASREPMREVFGAFRQVGERAGNGDRQAFELHIDEDRAAVRRAADAGRRISAPSSWRCGARSYTLPSGVMPLPPSVSEPSSK